ncbi:MAG: hypothetical protein ACOC34_07605 [Thermotogota bacterium]
MRIDPLQTVNTVFYQNNRIPEAQTPDRYSGQDPKSLHPVESVGTEKPRTVDELIEYAKSHDLKGTNATDPLVKYAKKIGVVECSTCANRKYQDQSTDAGVSFKNAAHISPDNAFAVVSAHEQEHVEEAKNRTSQEGSKLISASVRIFVSTCPECGRTYVSGGETRTVESHSNSPHNHNNTATTAIYNTEKGFSPNEGNMFDSVI